MGIIEEAEEYFRTYEVADLVSPRDRVALVLESPHIDEVRHGCPLAGRSGLSVTRCLFEGMADPIGLLVRSGRVRGLSIINVCRAPMQSSAVAPRDRGRFAAVLQALAVLRSATSATALQRSPGTAAVKDLMTVDFAERLGRHLEQCEAGVLVPCGAVARGYLGLLMRSGQFGAVGAALARRTILMDVPHPSYNNWEKPRYADALARLRSLVRSEGRVRVVAE